MTDINILVTRQAVNCGDHAQDITRTVSVDLDETVSDLVARTLTDRRSLQRPDHAYLTIRVAEESG